MVLGSPKAVLTWVSDASGVSPVSTRVEIKVVRGVTTVESGSARSVPVKACPVMASVPPTTTYSPSSKSRVPLLLRSKLPAISRVKLPAASVVAPGSSLSWVRLKLVSKKAVAPEMGPSKALAWMVLEIAAGVATLISPLNTA